MSDNNQSGIWLSKSEQELKDNILSNPLSKAVAVVVYRTKVLEALRELVAENYENYGITYFGGSLVFTLFNPELNNSLTICNVKDISDLQGEEREIQYLISKLYVKHKSSKHVFYEQAIKNINAYEGYEYGL